MKDIIKSAVSAC